MRMRVKDVASARPVAIAREASFERAIEMMEEHDVRHLPVLDGEQCVGVVSDRDLLEATGWLHPRELELLEAPKGHVGDLMRQGLVHVAPDAELEDTGLPQQVALFDRMRASTGATPPVLDGRQVMDDPQAALTALCEAVGLEFDPAMLSWEAGPRVPIAPKRLEGAPWSCLGPWSGLLGPVGCLFEPSGASCRPPF